jgi:AcrR family transcriptional regulator
MKKLILSNPRVDGRRQRSVQTRQHLIDAYLELLRENPKVPTAAQLARRAGCSERSVFERFSDLPALSLAVLDYAFLQATAQAVVRNVDGDRQTRIRSQVETRAATCERWLPLWRMMLRNQHQSKEVPPRIERIRDAIVSRLELMYRPELSSLSETDCRKLLITLETLTDFEAWGCMRERHNLSIEAARDVWIHSIDLILPPTPLASVGGVRSPPVQHDPLASGP